MHKYLLLLSLVCCQLSYGQAPTGYYDAAASLHGVPLKAALHNIIKNHNVISYNDLWTAYQTTDKKANGKVWDIYSDRPGGTPPYEYSFVSDQCGNYTGEGQCYNREHSWPKTYFNDVPPMNSDLFHIYPTDGAVNGKRDNDPYGEVDAPSWQSQNGSRSGPNNYPGYSGTAFEPIDSFKGDLARTYFYMSTRYYTEDNGWKDWAIADKADLKPWAIAMLLEWHHMDPVSQKEIDRNNAIYVLQHNRNPFIDNPDFADCIWGDASACTTTPVSIASVDVSGKIRLYPNPATNQVRVDLSLLPPAETLALDLLNTQGQLLYHKDLNKAGITTIDLSSYAKGLYWLRLHSARATGIKKLVIR
ncbi:endonuclease [Taibaiella koreensis]|uniref:endonuclease n=1 Tax=Taibaiella koreensis TaxID=1268548 RepID=UPI000E59DCC7|nr:endonuclease [Taibaiella koreensis]